jgi:predicted nucleic acid-binding protein
MKILIDTNIWIDFLAKREPHYNGADMLVRLVQAGVFEAYINSSSISDIAYIAKGYGIHPDQTYQFLDDLNHLVDFIPTTKNTLMNVIHNKPKDIGDGLLEHSAIANGIGTIITRDKDGFSWLITKTAHECVLDYFVELFETVDFQ